MAASAPGRVDEVRVLHLTTGGPGAGLLLRLRLIRPELGVGSPRTAIVLAAVTWLPLLILSIIGGVALGGCQIPFLRDIAAQTRFLFALPVLLLAEGTVGARLREMVAHLLDAGLVLPKDIPRFAEVVEDALRIRDSRRAELIVLALSYISLYTTFATTRIQTGSSWFEPDGGSFSWAGYWYVFVAMPIFQFLIYRWVYRMFVWGRFLRKVAQLDLNLSPAHPDGAGGLGFLGRSLVPFGTVMFALASVVSSSIASRVLFAKADLYSFIPNYVAMLVIALIVFAGPLLVFVPKLIRLKHHGLMLYGSLAARYTQLFDARWVRMVAHETDASVLGVGDIQSLADLGNSYEFVHKMKAVPIEPNDFLMLLVPAMVPAVPLLATVMSVTDILKGLFRLIA